MFVIAEIQDLTLGKTYLRETWNDAVDLATELASQQCDHPKEEIRNDVDVNGAYCDPDGEWSVSIGQVED
jgi:hypothetical protein